MLLWVLFCFFSGEIEGVLSFGVKALISLSNRETYNLFRMCPDSDVRIMLNRISE